LISDLSGSTSGVFLFFKKETGLTLWLILAKVGAEIGGLKNLFFVEGNKGGKMYGAINC
jgi:hypothetical protein